MSDAVRQIKERLNIVDVVSSYVELHKAGKNFKGKSPFSNERTPSFYVSPDRGMYYCFSTSQGGDMFTFVQTIEGVDFREALKILADRAGVELVPEAPEKRSERDRLYALLEDTTKFFEEWMTLAPAAAAYLEKRSVKPITMAKWRIGYAPGPLTGGWRLLKDHLATKGYSVVEMLKAGVVKPGADGKEPFDVFRDRVMFPLRDAAGKVVGFSGRTLTPDEKTPKYVNSPETELYKKSELLFGYDLAKNTIRTLDFSLIVEGQFDVVMSHQAGYTNTVAVSGTALTPHHVQLLERLSTRVVLALDADRAGIAAMGRAANLMLRRGFDVKVAQLPAGADPADLVQKDAGALKTAVGQALPVIEFLLNHLREKTADDRAYKLLVREEVVPYVAVIPNRIDQEHFVGLVANALGVSSEAVKFEVTRVRDTNTSNDSTANSKSPSALIPTISSNQARGDQRTAFTTWLLSASTQLPGTSGKRVESLLAQILGTTVDEIYSSLTEADIARATIEIENRYHNTNEKALIADVAATLNLLAEVVIKEEIAGCRRVLREAEATGGDVAGILTKITALESRRRRDPVVLEDIL